MMDMVTWQSGNDLDILAIFTTNLARATYLDNTRNHYSEYKIILVLFIDDHLIWKIPEMKALCAIGIQLPRIFLILLNDSPKLSRKFIKKVGLLNSRWRDKMSNSVCKIDGLPNDVFWISLILCILCGVILIAM